MLLSPSTNVRDVKMNHPTCKSAKRTPAGASVKCYSLFVKTKVLSSIVGALAALVMLAFSRTLNAEQVSVLKNVNVIDGTGAPAQPNTTVVIESDRIRSIATEQTDTPPNAKGFSQRAPLYRCTGELRYCQKEEQKQDSPQLLRSFPSKVQDHPLGNRSGRFASPHL
jgi:hypothetical protein